MALQIKKSAQGPLNSSLDTFWRQFQHECFELAQKFPNIDAERKIRADGSRGMWTIKGPYNGVKAFCDLAVTAAEKLGFKGSRGAAVQWFLDELRGDHMVRRAARDPYQKDDTYSVVTNPDGSKQGYRGRQKVAY